MKCHCHLLLIKNSLVVPSQMSINMVFSALFNRITPEPEDNLTTLVSTSEVVNMIYYEATGN